SDFAPFAAFPPRDRRFTPTRRRRPTFTWAAVLFRPSARVLPFAWLHPGAKSLASTPPKSRDGRHLPPLPDRLRVRRRPRLRARNDGEVHELRASIPRLSAAIVDAGCAGARGVAHRAARGRTAGAAQPRGATARYSRGSRGARRSASA